MGAPVGPQPSGLLSTLAARVSATEDAKKQKKLDDLSDRINTLLGTINNPLLIQMASDPTNPKQAWAQNEIDKAKHDAVEMETKYGGPEIKEHRGFLSRLVHGLGRGFGDVLGYVGPSGIPQIPVGPSGLAGGGQPSSAMPAALATPMPGLAQRFSVPGAAPISPTSAAPAGRALPSSLAPQGVGMFAPAGAGAAPPPPGLSPQLGYSPQAMGRPVGGMFPMSPEALAQARLSNMALGPQFVQKRNQIVEAMKQGILTPAQGQAAMQAALSGSPDNAAKLDYERQLLDIKDLHDQGQRDKALEKLQSLKDQNVVNEEDYSRLRTELETGLTLPTPRTTGVGEQSLTWALEAKAIKLGRLKPDGTPDINALTPQEKLDAQNEAKAGDLGAPYTVEDAEAAANLKPGQKNEGVLIGQPSRIARAVKDLAEYKIPWPGGYAIARPDSMWPKVLELLDKYDPTPGGWSEPKYEARRQTNRDYAPGGKDAQNIVRINTLVGHLGRLYDAAQALKNYPSGKFGIFTGAANWVKNVARLAKQDPKLATFEDDLNAVSNELAAVYKGTGAPGQEDVRSWRERANASSSADALVAHVNEAVQLMYGRSDNMREQYEATMGEPLRALFFSPESVRTLTRITGEAPPGPASIPEATPTPPATPAPPAATDTGAPAAVPYYDPKTKKVVRPQ